MEVRVFCVFYPEHARMRIPERTDGGVALPAILVHRASDHVAEARDEIGALILDAMDAALDHAAEELSRILGRERRATGQRFVHADAERVDVDARIDVLRRADLLGRHVAALASRRFVMRLSVSSIDKPKSAFTVPLSMRPSAGSRCTTF
jgi:hypothetical protein